MSPDTQPQPQRPRAPSSSKPPVVEPPIQLPVALATTPTGDKPLTLRHDIFRCFDPKKPEPPAAYRCIVCTGAITTPLVKMDVPYKGCTYSYEAHKACWDGINDNEKRLYDKCLLRLLEEGAR
jgi:hypothetical protein